MNNLPDKGDLVWVSFSPQVGHEQAGHRPALVVSPKIYHEKTNFSLVCPVTSNVNPWPWKVLLPEESAVKGAILTDQIRTIDRKARKLKVIESVNADILSEVIAKIEALIGWGRGPI